VATPANQAVTPSGIRVKDVMRRPGATLSPDATVRDAVTRMRALNVPVLPVVDAGNALLGVTRADALSQVAEAEQADALRSRVVSTVTATPEMDVGRLAEMMRYKGLDWIPVLEARQLVGELTLVEAETASRRA
jgi:CBS domain-containing protein